MALFTDGLEREGELVPFRVGLVVERDAARVAVRVRFPERDQMVSWWLPVVVPKTQDDKWLWLPDEGEQVVCLMDEHDEAGVVLGAIYSAADAAPVLSTEKFHVAFKDGTKAEYDRESHVMRVNYSDEAAVKYDAGAHQFEVTLPEGGTASLDAPGGIELKSSGQIELSDDSAGVVLKSGGSEVRVAPGGVSVVPPLPITSTVAQT
ncbi:MAG: phage baseplate assembly protein V [Candidatus Binataceae bacterium]